MIRLVRSSASVKEVKDKDRRISVELRPTKESKMQDAS